MKPRRWAWNIFCAFSLLIFATSVTIWGRSYFIADAITHWSSIAGSRSQTADGHLVHYIMITERGAVFVQRAPGVAGVAGAEAGRWTHETSEPDFVEYLTYRLGKAGDFQLAGIRVFRSYAPDGEDGIWVRSAVLPLWLFLIFAVPPLVWWRQRRKRLGPARGGRGFPLAAEPPEPDLNAQAS